MPVASIIHRGPPGLPACHGEIYRELGTGRYSSDLETFVHFTDEITGQRERASAFTGDLTALARELKIIAPGRHALH